ncbi:MAG: tRNA adenosine(34) deaminase TadA [Clostridia bacterium]|nr:tRNA adenosine(34) deaminase TadA [Clostridia bacterium]
MTEEMFMRRALELAAEAAEAGEVPVGCVIVRDGKILSEGRNRRETDRNALAHAEIEAIEGACRALGGWRLTGCTLYVTLEPCPMCAGAIVNARIPRVVYGAKDARAGAMGSLINVNSYPLNHHAQVENGVLAGECAGILREFFSSRRRK